MRVCDLQAQVISVDQLEPQAQTLSETAPLGFMGQ
jgi:hypothetical protein